MRLRFGYREFAGGLGDIGTLLPLLIALSMINGVSISWTLAVFGLLYIYSGLFFRIPIPVQPMKAIAVISVATGVSPATIRAASLIMAIFLLIFIPIFSERIVKEIPSFLIRGIQLGLAFKLIISGIGLVQSEGKLGWVILLICLIIAIPTERVLDLPSILTILAVGVVASITLNLHPSLPKGGALPPLPTFHELLTALTLLAIPQIPLTLGNAVLATSSLSRDYFNKNGVDAQKLLKSHVLMNIVSFILGGVPVCHGAGGLAAHYRFGARTGGALIMAGLFFIALSLLGEGAVSVALNFIPISVLAAMLLMVSIELLKVVKRLKRRWEIYLAVGLGILCASHRLGFLIALTLGTAGWYIGVRLRKKVRSNSSI